MSAETLREAARLMRNDWSERGDARFCQCEESDVWFDRTICPEPCGSMHNVCTECGRIKGYCPVAVDDSLNADRLARTWQAVADWLDDTAAGWPWDGEEPGVVDWDGDRITFSESVDSRALAVATAYLGQPAPTDAAP